MTWSHGASGDQKRIIKIDEFGAEAEDGFVEEVVEFNHGPKAQSVVDAKVACDVEIEDEEALGPWLNSTTSSTKPSSASAPHSSILMIRFWSPDAPCDHVKSV